MEVKHSLPGEEKFISEAEPWILRRAEEGSTLHCEKPSPKEVGQGGLGLCVLEKVLWKGHVYSWVYH